MIFKNILLLFFGHINIGLIHFILEMLLFSCGLRFFAFHLNIFLLLLWLLLLVLNLTFWGLILLIVYWFRRIYILLIVSRLIWLRGLWLLLLVWRMLIDLLFLLLLALGLHLLVFVFRTGSFNFLRLCFFYRVWPLILSWLIRRVAVIDFHRWGNFGCFFFLILLRLMCLLLV